MCVLSHLGQVRSQIPIFVQAVDDGFAGAANLFVQFQQYPLLMQVLRQTLRAGGGVGHRVELGVAIFILVGLAMGEVAAFVRLYVVLAIEAIDTIKALSYGRTFDRTFFGGFAGLDGDLCNIGQLDFVAL